MQQPPNDQPNWQQPQYEDQLPQYHPSYPQQPSQPNWPPQQSGQLPPQYPQQGYPQYTQYPQQPPTGPGMPPPQWQQPYPYQQPGMPPQYPMPPQQPPRQPDFFRRKAGCLPMWAVLLIIAIFACAGASAIANSGNTTTTTTTTSDNGAQVAATNSAQGTTDTPVPTATLDTSIPTSTPAPTSGQTESAYKKSTTSTTVDNLDKNGNADKDKDVHFTCKILKFVKDDNGNTAGANVESPDTYSSSILQIVFPSGTDITRLNEGDTVEVWGTDAGVFSGQNAFGGTVQEVGIVAQYMTDKTTNYQTH